LIKRILHAVQDLITGKDTRLDPKGFPKPLGSAPKRREQGGENGHQSHPSQ
jgi:hypothetical protein